MTQTLHQLVNFITSLESYDATSIQNLQTAVQCLDQLCQTHSKQIAKQIDNVLSIFQLCLTEYSSSNQLITVAHFLDFIVGVINVHPKLAKNNKNRCVRLFRNCLNTLTKISPQTSEVWLNPPNGYSDDYNQDQPSDNEVEKQLCSTFDILSQTIGRNACGSWFEPVFKQYLSVPNDWRFPYSALILASQICGKPFKLQFAHVYVESAVMYLQNPYPKVRYACLHLIGMFSDQMNPQFQQKYYDGVLPAMIKLLQDPTPRVVAHTLACFTNFFDGMNEVWKIQSCIGQILPIITFYLKNANTWITQNAVGALCSFATTKDAFGPNLTQILEIANEIIIAYVGKPQYTQLINQCFQLISHIIVCQPKNQVQQYLPNFVTLLFNNRSKISESYFLNTWSRLCSQYELFTDITQVFDQIFQSVKNLLSDESDQSAQQALQALSNTCVSFKTTMKDFVPRIVSLAKEVYQDKQKSNTLKEYAISLILKAIINAKCEAPGYFEEWQKIVIDTILYLFGSIKNILEQNYPELQYLYSGLKGLIEDSIQILSEAQIQEFAVKLQQSLAKNEQNYRSLDIQKKNLSHNFDDDEVQSNQNQIYTIDESLKALEYCLQSAPQIFESLLLTKAPVTKQWLINLIAQQSALYITKQKQWRLLGLNLSVILIEKCQFQEISTVWGEIMTLFTSYSNSPHTRIRNSAVYGMGVVFLKTPIDLAQEANVTQWLQCLWNAFSLPYSQDIQDQDLIQHSCDNVVSTLGKLLFKYGDKHAPILQKQIYQLWFSKLPLNTDKSEGDIQQSYLNQLLTNNPGMILSNVEDLKNILVEYCSYIKKRSSYKGKKIISQTKAALKIITNWPIFKESVAYLWSNMSKSQINMLTRFMAD